MPRIPQSQFNTVPSQNVGAANPRQAPDAAGNLMSQVANVVGAFGILKDQQERTEAYATANDVKREYIKQKMEYTLAMKSSDSNGNYSIVDPNDANPDITKRRRISGNLSDKYSEMKEYYNKSRDNLKNITRSDIATDLVDQYVGDDLVDMNLRTNQFLNKKKETEVTEGAIENLQIQFSGISQAVSDGEAPEVVAALTKQANQRLRQEAETIRPIIGEEKYQQIQKARDRYSVTVANEIVRNGVTNGTVAASEQLISTISNPMQREMARSALERTKRTTVTVKNVALINSSNDITQKLMSMPTLNDADYLKVVETAKNVKNMYINESYGGVTREQADQSSANLMAMALSKRVLQNNISSNLQFLSDPSISSELAQNADGSRTPSGALDSNAQSLAALKEQISAEIDDSGLSKVTGIDRDALISGTIQQMRNNYGDVRRYVSDMVSQDNPELRGREKLEKISYIAEQNGFGDVPLVSTDEIKIFKQDFNSNLAKDPRAALESFNRNMENAGDSFQGEGSYRRALAIDLADKDPKLAFIIPMADSAPDVQFRMAQNAGKFDMALSEYKDKLSMTKLVNEFNKTEMANMVNMKDNSVYVGLRQAMIHDAAARVADSRGGLSLSSAMDETREYFNSMYSVVSSEDGTSSVIGLSRKGGTNFAESKKELSIGMQEVVKLPSMSKAEKVRILDMNEATRGRFNEHTPDDHINFILSKTLSIQPDARYPNMNVMMLGNRRIVDNNGKVLKYSTDDILTLGKNKKKSSSSLSMDRR